MKPDANFGLENAAWPAILVSVSGLIRFANQAARTAFAANIIEDTTQLSAIWAGDNDTAAEQFLARLDRAPKNEVTAKLKLRGGAVGGFTCHVCGCTQDGQKHFLFQFFLHSVSAAPGQTEVIKRPDIKAEAVEASVAHKQKLDCALKLTRTVALDFNNALTSILGHTSLLLSRMEPETPWRGSLVEIEKSAEKAAEIAHDLAMFSHQEVDPRARIAGNLNDLLRRVVELFQTPAAAELDWKLHLESRLYTVNIDEAKIQQAFVKIVENATQAVDATGRIVVLSRNRDITEPTKDGNVTLAPGCYVLVEISDNGAGIASEVLPRIFEPFFTTKPGHRGLGLAWVYGIMTNHGGNVAVSSQSGQGTSVRVYLPAQQKIVKEKRFKDDDLRGAETILMVDDEDLLLTMGHMILTSFGYRVLTANSGEQALRIIQKGDKQIDLVITDLVMPGMSGRELIERLRTLAPGLKIICATGYVRSAKQAEEDESSLQKPFTSQDLLLKVKEVLTADES